MPSFVSYDPGFGENLEDGDSLYAVRNHLSAQNVDPSALRGFWASRSVHYQRNVPDSLDERIRQYLAYLLGEGHGDTHEAYFIYHNLLNILAAQMLSNGDFDPTAISNEQISNLLTNLLAGRGSGGRNGTGQSFGSINDMSSYDEFRRLYAFLQNFDGTEGLDVAFVINFFRHMDNHSGAALVNVSQSNVRAAGAGAVADFLHDISQEEALFLFLSYVWATNSGRTYEESRALFGFGQAGAGVILSAAGTARRLGYAGALASPRASHLQQRAAQPSGAWTSRPVTLTSAGGSSIPTRNVSDLPQNAQDAFWRYDNHGWRGAPPGMSSGINAGHRFSNSRSSLPITDSSGRAVTYKTFDINLRISARGRDAERFVVGSDGSIFFTDDHYLTFIRIR